MFASIMTCVFAEGNSSEEYITELSEVDSIEKSIQLKLKELKIHVVNIEKHHMEMIDLLMNECDQYNDVLELFVNELPQSYADFGVTIDCLIDELDNGLNEKVKKGLIDLDDAYWAIADLDIPQELKELELELNERVNDLVSSNDSFKSIFMELLTIDNQIDDIIWDIRKIV